MRPTESANGSEFPGSSANCHTQHDNTKDESLNLSLESLLMEEHADRRLTCALITGFHHGSIVGSGFGAALPVSRG
jgi:hypothetical protein